MKPIAYAAKFEPISMNDGLIVIFHDVPRERSSRSL